VALGPTSIMSDLIELDGAGLQIVEFGDPPDQRDVGVGVLRIGVHRWGPRPQFDLDAFDLLLSSDPLAPCPWVGIEPERMDASLDRLKIQIAGQPVAAAALAQVLRMTLQVTFDDALVLESLAYSMLLASAGFRGWRDIKPVRVRDDVGPRVLLHQTEDGLQIQLARSAVGNAFDARMRDELVEALQFALVHPDAPKVYLSAKGRSFSTGGDLDTFGTARDAGGAHMIRLLRSPVRLVHQLGDRITARLQGACIGAGIEVPAASARVIVRADAYFQLPELAMGLIPGAGGTVSISRRIGRQRTAYLAISGDTLGAQAALAWGLVDAVET